MSAAEGAAAGAAAGGPYGALAGAGIGALGSFFGQKSANRANAAIAEQAHQNQIYMHSTMYQRQARDLKNAGLNKMLAFGAQPSPIAQAPQAHMENEAEGMANSAKNMGALVEEIEQIRSQTELNEEQKKVAAEMKKVHRATAKSINADIPIKLLKNFAAKKVNEGLQNNANKHPNRNVRPYKEKDIQKHKRQHKGSYHKGTYYP